MNRRTFSHICLGALVAGLGAAGGALRRFWPRRASRADRPRSFPGRVESLDARATQRPSRWLG